MSLSEYQNAIKNIVQLVSYVNEISNYIDLNSVSLQTVGTRFSPINTNSLASTLGVQYSKLPQVVNKANPNNVLPLAVTASKIANTITPEVIDNIGSKYGLSPEVIQNLKTYVKLATVLPSVVMNNRPAVVANNSVYSQQPQVLENTY